MSSIVFRFIVILGVLWVGISALFPTYQWYFKLSDEQKVIANTGKKDFQVLIQKIENNIQVLRTALEKEENYKIASSQKNQKKSQFIVDVSLVQQNYKLDTDFSTFKTIVQQLNPVYNNYSLLEKSYTELQRDITKLNTLQTLQAIKNQSIKLGLDIAGGVHFSLSIDEKKMKEILDEQYTKTLQPDNIQNLVLKENSSLSGDALKSAINNKKQELLKEKDEKFQAQKEQGIDQALVKIRNRVDQFGVSEPVIIKGPNNTIVVELAGEKDIESAKAIFTRVGVLSFQIVDEETMVSIPLENKSYTGEVINPAYKNTSSSRSSFLAVQGTDKFGQSVDEGYLSVLNNVELTGSYISSAQVETNQLGQTTIAFRLDSIGSETFANITKNNVGKRLAIVLDGKVQSAPSIREAITGGSGSISGDFSLKEANLLATILRSGSLPVPLKIEEERIIGPSLGQEEVTKGVYATLLALAFVIVFVFVYYGFWGGLSTNIAQVLNLGLILSIMAQLGATLTLPGIAAIILTIGMAVDANIIIHERVKEDLRAGYSLSSAIISGYQSAFKTILDSNITTFIPGLILASMGDGPVRGFGITLMIGLVTNLFTAVFCTRLFYDFIIYSLKIQNIFWSRSHAKK